MSRVLPQEPSFDPARWDEDARAVHLAKGIALFNAAEYEEAHEEFEMLWLSTQGPDSDFFKFFSKSSGKPPASIPGRWAC